MTVATLESAIPAASEAVPTRASLGGQIEATNLAKIYGAAGYAKTVVRDCSFTIEHGKLTVMIGPSGCGKSTLIRMVAGFERPTVGTLTIDGNPISGPGLDRLVVFQETALFPWMSTYDNIMYGPRARGADNQETRELAEFLLRKVGLSDFAHKYPPQLSGGMQRRAELARALINNPSVMILDEPFRGLDAMTKKLMQEYYAKLYEDAHGTTFFVTTDIDEAIYLADRILVMTNIPTSVRAVLAVDLPRPRRLEDIIENDDANRIKMEALSLLHEEAMKSFARGSKAAAEFVEAYSKRLRKAE